MNCANRATCSAAGPYSGIVLAAGAGVRLRPLTRLRPKVLCPVGDVVLVDHALARFDGVTSSVAVNVHHGRMLLEAHLAGRVHLSFEEAEPLGTAGAVGRLRDWIAGRPLLVVNGDTWVPAGLAPLVDGWDGERIRLLVPGTVTGAATLTPRSPIAGALMPWTEVARLAAEPAGLYEVSWAPAAAAGRVEVIAHGGPFHDCGTPARYLAANLAWSGGESVVGRGALVEPGAEVVRSVVWPGAVVSRSERLVETIRASDRVTVLVR